MPPLQLQLVLGYFHGVKRKNLIGQNDKKDQAIEMA